MSALHDVLEDLDLLSQSGDCGRALEERVAKLRAAITKTHDPLLAAAERLLEYFDQDAADDDAHTIGIKVISHGTRGRALELRESVAQAKGGGA